MRGGQPRPDINSVAALKRTLLNAKSVAYSRSGQSGIHFAKVIGAQSTHVQQAQALIHALRTPHAVSVMREAGLTPV